MLEDGNTSRQLFSIRFILVAATFGRPGIAYFFRFQSLPVDKPLRPSERAKDRARLLTMANSPTPSPIPVHDCSRP